MRILWSVLFVVSVVVVVVAATPTTIFAPPQYLPLDPQQQSNNNNTKSTQQQNNNNNLVASQVESRQESTNKYDRCVFIHGLGHTEATEPTTTPHNELIWTRSLVNHTKQCASHVFLSEDTSRQAWFDGSLSESICAHIMPAGTTDNILRNTMLFTYSLGTICLAAALESGKCALDETTTSWHAIGFYPPFTKQQDHPTVGDELHREKDGVNKLKDTLAKLNFTRSLKGSFTEDGKDWSRGVMCCSDGPKCDNNISQQRKERVLELIQNKVNSAICGTTSEGFAKQNPELVIVSRIWTKDRPILNDGTVSYNQCSYVAKEGKEVFQKNPLSRFYVGKMNHFELVCGGSDGTGDEEKPCAWFASRE